MPKALPLQTMRRQGRSSTICESMETPPVCQLKEVPGAMAPSSSIFWTLLFQRGHAAISVSTSQTRLTGAAMSISARAETGTPESRIIRAVAAMAAAVPMAAAVFDVPKIIPVLAPSFLRHK